MNYPISAAGALAIMFAANGIPAGGAPVSEHVSHGNIVHMGDPTFDDLSTTHTGITVDKQWEVRALKDIKAADGLRLQRVIPHDSFDTLRGPDGKLAIDKMQAQSWTPIPSDDPGVEAPTTLAVPAIKAGETGIIHLELTFRKPGHYVLCYRVVKLVDGEYVPTSKGTAPLWADIIVK